MNQVERKRYAISFVSFCLNRLDLRVINRIILFGSVATGTSSPTSDVDLFFDVDLTKKETKELKKKIEQLIEEFKLSTIGLEFKAKGIDNEFSVVVGKLSEWEELKESIASTGIILYGRPIPLEKPERASHQLIFSFENLRIKNRGAFLNKLYGYEKDGKHYEGLLEKWGGKKIGKSAVMFPIDKKETFEKVLDHYGVDYRVIEVFI